MNRQNISGIKFLLALLCIITFTSGNVVGQIYKSTYVVGGSLSGGFSNGEIKGGGADDKYSTIEISLNPKAGYFFMPQFAAGLGVDFVYQTQEFEGEGNDTSTSVILGGPFVRYYFLNHIFVEGVFGYGVNTINDTRQVDLMRTSGGVGYAAFINEKVAIEPMIRYVYDSRKAENNIKETKGTVLFSAGLQIYLYRNNRSVIRQTL